MFAIIILHTKSSLFEWSNIISSLGSTEPRTITSGMNEIKTCYVIIDFKYKLSYYA